MKRKGLIVSLLLLNATLLFCQNGATIIDSNLIVRDSVSIGKNLFVSNNTTIGGKLKLNNLEQTNSFMNTDKFLIVDENGNTKVLLTPIEVGGTGKKPDILANTNCIGDQNGKIVNPLWKNSTNIIYTSCPQINIGINNSNPRVKLDVDGEIFGTKFIMGYASTANLGNKYLYLKTATSTPKDAKIFVLENNASEIFSIQNDGKIYSNDIAVNGKFQLNTGIDYTNTSNVFLIENQNQKIIQINNQGQLQARKIIVNMQSWPDYVFDLNYNLTPLLEVEKFIKLHSHLPDVPSENEIKETGVDVGEMNKILLQKIEELTLYLIDQQKEIDELKSQINIHH